MTHGVFLGLKAVASSHGCCCGCDRRRTEARSAPLNVAPACIFCSPPTTAFAAGQVRAGRRAGDKIAALVPAKAGTQSQAMKELDSRFRGNERRETYSFPTASPSISTFRSG